MPQPAWRIRSANDAFRERITLCGRATLLAFLIGWAGWTYPWDDFLDRSGTPLGADYAMFYVAGQMVHDGDADHLYDQAEHQRRLHALFPGVDRAFCLPFRYPPFVALLMVPLAALPYAVSWGVFLTISLTAGAVAMGVMAQDVQALRGGWRKPVLWAIAGWPVAWETLVGGQATLVGLAILCGGLALLWRERFFLAGAVLALAAYKPNLLALVVLGCVVRYPRLLRGLVPTLGLLGLLACVPGGWNVCRGYLAFGSQMAVSAWEVETPAWKLHSLAGWLALVPHFPGRLVSVGLGVVTSLAIAVRWRRSADNPVVFGWSLALLVASNALFNPYTPIYDLTLLLVPCLLATECVAAAGKVVRHAGAVQCALAALYFGPHVSQRIAQTTLLQPFTLVLGGMVCWLAVQFFRATAGERQTVPILEPARWAEC